MAGGLIMDRMVFRKWSEGDIIALMVDYAACRMGYECVSYMHFGQHGGADPRNVVQATRPASESEYAPLLAELTRIGYRPRVLRRVPSDALARRRESVA